MQREHGIIDAAHIVEKGAVRPEPTTTIHADYTVMSAGPDGSVDGDPFGLFDYDTRILSRYRLTVDGRPPELIASNRPEADTFVARYRVRRGSERAGPEGPLLPEDAIELALRRVVGSGLRDHWTVANHSALPWAGRVRVDVDADFIDIAEVARERRQGGQLTSRVRGRGLELRYVARRGTTRLERGVRVRLIAGSAGEKVAAEAFDDGIELELDLEPRASVAFRIVVGSLVAGRWRTPHDADGISGRISTAAREREAWRARRLRVEGPAALEAPVERAIEDLYALRNRDLERELLDGHGPTNGTRDGNGAAGSSGAHGWLLNAGVPTFTGFFGRDTLTAGWQSLLAGPAALRGALNVAAALQAKTDDPWRDAEPGKMLHELRRGPLSMLGLSPRDAYYGSQTTPSIFVVALSELWHWAGDAAVLRRFRDAALRAIDWSERRRDLGGGLLAYERRSPAGLRNQGWKDSDEAIRHADGRIAEPPIATVEEQAFQFLALQRMAEMLLVLDEPDAADGFMARAEELRTRFHEAFWMPDKSFYAMAIDRDGAQVGSITSNPGHALATGIVPREVARTVADRLLAPDLFSGWGVRTLSADHPSYNPLAYHLGTVWPVENATFALGFKRYGLDDHFDRLVDAMLSAAGHAPDQRLPEALTGHRREPDVAPLPYPNANCPQAWSASAVIHTVQLMLGIYPMAPLRTLTLIRPRLPVWLPEITLRNLRVGRATLDLRFTRRDDGSAAHKVLRQDGTLFVVAAGPPADATGNGGSRLEEIGRVALARAPGRLVRAARIAIGLDRVRPD